MPRSQRNDNFIDKTFTIVADILLRIIPMAPEEKEAFTYYRDGVIWYFFRSSPFGKEKVFGNPNWVKENLRSVKVSSGNRTIPSVVYPRSMQP